jgi:peptide/nickel transport system substrate-binding protein
MKRLRRPLVCALALSVFAPHALSAGTVSEVRIGIPQQPNTLNPLIGSQFYENYLDCAIYSGLVVIDDRGRPAPDLIQNVPTRANGGVSADGRNIVYILRPGVRWQDNVPLTASDVAFTFERMRDPKTGFPATSQYDNVESVEARDAQTVVVHLKQPEADAVSEIFVNGQNGSILPRHVLAHVADMRRSAFNEHPVGSGPYIVESWQRDNGLRLRANHGYFVKRPQIERLRVDFVPDANTMALRLRAGELDFAPGITPAAVETLRKTPSLRVVDAPSYTVIILANRVDAAPLDDARVRRALGLEIDRSAVARKAYLGHAQPASELVPPWSPYATMRAAHPADPKTARALLDAAGWRTDSDGVRERGGQRLNLTLTTIAGARALLTAATLLQAQWRSIGIDVALRAVQSNALFAPDGVLARANFQFALIGYGFATTPDRSPLLASRSVPPNGINYARYRNGAVDKAIDEARTAPDAAARRRAFATIGRRVAADAPYGPIVWIDTIYAISTQLDGVRPETVNSDLWNVYAWRLRR